MNDLKNEYEKWLEIKCPICDHLFITHGPYLMTGSVLCWAKGYQGCDCAYRTDNYAKVFSTQALLDTSKHTEK